MMMFEVYTTPVHGKYSSLNSYDPSNKCSLDLCLHPSSGLEDLQELRKAGSDYHFRIYFLLGETCKVIKVDRRFKAFESCPLFHPSPQIQATHAFGTKNNIMLKPFAIQHLFYTTAEVGEPAGHYRQH